MNGQKRCMKAVRKNGRFTGQSCNKPKGHTGTKCEGAARKRIQVRHMKTVLPIVTNSNSNAMIVPVVTGSRFVCKNNLTGVGR